MIKTNKFKLKATLSSLIIALGAFTPLSVSASEVAAQVSASAASNPAQVLNIVSEATRLSPGEAPQILEAAVDATGAEGYQIVAIVESIALVLEELQGQTVAVGGGGYDVGSSKSSKGYSGKQSKQPSTFYTVDENAKERFIRLAASMYPAYADLILALLGPGYGAMDLLAGYFPTVDGVGQIFLPETVLLGTPIVRDDNIEEEEEEDDDDDNNNRRRRPRPPLVTR